MFLLVSCSFGFQFCARSRLTDKRIYNKESGELLTSVALSSVL